MTKRFSAILRLALVSLSLTFATCASAQQNMQPLYTNNDAGGSMEAARLKFLEWNQSGRRVVINGLCVSACTMVVILIPHDRICVTGAARLIFHAITRKKDDGIVWPEMSTWFESKFPSEFRLWLAQKQAFKSLEYTQMKGAELESRIPRCEQPIYSMPLPEQDAPHVRRFLAKLASR